MREDGQVQRVGLARSDDLYTWHKDRSDNYPLEIPGSYYEHGLDEGRHWVSFRDPYCFQEDGKVYLLAAARINQGPVIRRGCVSLAKETTEDYFQFASPLFQPGHYDDIEVPNLLKFSDDHGELHLKSFAGFDKLASQSLTSAELAPIELLFDSPHASVTTTDSICRCACESGFEGFLLQGEYADFILSGELNMEGRGKCGFLFRLNDQGDGYCLSLDLFKGIAQIRAWGHRPKGEVEEAYFYDQLQASHFVPITGSHSFRTVIHQQYLEFSLNGYVLLTLADNVFEQGRVGFYAENAQLRFEDLTMKVWDQPAAKSYPRSMANY
jgi:hypothetical protein